jgi:hypothetical protein
MTASGEPDFLVDRAEVQSEQTGLRSLLGGVRALEAAAPGGPGPDA